MTDLFSHLELLKLVVDAGMFVLIWIVQLVIYPGFCYYSEPAIKRWHRLYTRRVTWVVLPLMLSQFLLYGLASYTEPSMSNIGSLVLVITLWLITFLVAVPLHRNIDTEEETVIYRQKLLQVNWSRTILWTIILIITIINYGT